MHDHDRVIGPTMPPKNRSFIHIKCTFAKNTCIYHHDVKIGPMMPPGSSAVSLTYLASERVVPGYGGGMSSAKAQLESDTKVRTLCKCVCFCFFSVWYTEVTALVQFVCVTPVAGSIFGPLSQTHISKRVFMNEISSSALLDIQLTLFCVCGVDSFLPELEHL